MTTDPVLLRVETAALRVEIRGPLASARVDTLGLDPPPAHLTVDAHGEAATVQCSVDAGALSTWSAGAPGPRFFEATRYKIVAVSRSGNIPPEVVHRDPGLIRDVVTIAGQPVTIGSFDFRQQAGRSDLTVRVGSAAIDLTIEVFPTKLDYADDHRSLLQGVASAARGLAFEYLRSTYARVGAEAAKAPTELEWIALLKRHLDALERALRFINDRPHRSLHRAFASSPLERARGNDASLRSALRRGAGTGPWVDVPGLDKARSRVPMRRVEETLDTPEHRWLKHQLAAVRSRLAEIGVTVASEIEEARLTGRPWPQRLDAELDEIRNLGGRVDRMLGLPFLGDVRSVSGSAELSSLTLMAAPGYAEAYACLLALRLGLHIQGDNLDLSTKELDALYEAWCFIHLTQLVVRLTGAPPDVAQIVTADASGLRVRLPRGQRSDVTLKTPTRDIVLSYNRSFPGLTGTQRPDIVISFRYGDRPEIIVVFDAKYRVDVSPEYLKTFKTPGPPIDAVNALHRYRDAIVVDRAGSSLARPVVKGVALFPLSAIKARKFKRHSLYRSLEALGIGAIPFLPNHTGLVEEWLTHLLELPPEELVDAGPPRLG